MGSNHSKAKKNNHKIKLLLEGKKMAMSCVEAKHFDSYWIYVASTLFVLSQIC